MTRSYSVGPAEPGEETDHPHHRSIWFGYEGINGVDYWHGGEFGSLRTYPAGSEAYHDDKPWATDMQRTSGPAAKIELTTNRPTDLRRRCPGFVLSDSPSA
jgi:hypothetical protein